MDIHVYGADWCSLTFRLREYLTQTGLPYDYHNVERDPAADDLVRTKHDGLRRFPMVIVEDCIVTNPTLAQLAQLLEDQQVGDIGDVHQDEPGLRQ